MSEFRNALEDEVMVNSVADFFEICVDEYVEMVSDAWTVTPLNAGGGSTCLSTQAWQAGPCLLTQLQVSPLIYDIQPVHVGVEAPILTFEKLLSGFQYGERGGKPSYFCPGPIYLTGNPEVGASIATEMSIQEFYVPRDMVGIPDNQLAPNTAIVENSLIGKIVHAEWNAIFESLTNGQGQIAKHAVQRLAAALKMALGVNPQREDVRSQARELLLRQIQRFIVENLESPNLTVGLIVRCHGVSRASLYRMFEAYGGIRQYITHMRVSKAMFDIWQNEAQRGIVRSAQTRWGFSSGNDFNRNVRRLFGNTPKRLFSSVSIKQDLTGGPSPLVTNFLDGRWAGACNAPTEVAA